MEIQLKQRLVGITVIFSLAVIFLPMLLDGSGRSPQHLDVSIPPAPEISSDNQLQQRVIELKKKAENLTQLKPVIVDEISDPIEKEEIVKKENDEKPTEPTVAKTEQKPQPVTEKPPLIKKQPEQKAAPVAQKKPQPKPQVGGLSYVIQIGSFQDKSKAYKERDRLRKSKLSAVFIERYVNKGVPSYRVRMGPFLSKKKAKVVSNKIRAKYNIKGLVMKYEK